MKVSSVLILSLSLVLLVNICEAQLDFVPSKEYIAWNKNQISQRSPSTNGYERINRTLEVSAWVVSPNGEPLLTNDTVNLYLNQASTYFEAIGLSFRACRIQPIYDYQYLTVSNNYLLDGINDDELRNTYYNDNTINMYFVGYPIRGTDTVGGFAPMPVSATELNSDEKPDYVVINAYSGNIGETIAHELGHYFGLFHTHEEDFDNDGELELELVDGSNCQTTGDLMCDTPAEPNLQDYVDIITCAVDASEILAERDPNGAIYIPNPGNIMSYSPASCYWGFSQEQLEKMVLVYNAFRTNLR